MHGAKFKYFLLKHLAADFRTNSRISSRLITTISCNLNIFKIGDRFTVYPIARRSVRTKWLYHRRIAYSFEWCFFADVIHLIRNPKLLLLWRLNEHSKHSPDDFSRVVRTATMVFDYQWAISKTSDFKAVECGKRRRSRCICTEDAMQSLHTFPGPIFELIC